MPSRDHDPSAHHSPEDLRPESRWGSEPPRDPDRRYGRAFEPPRPRERESSEGPPEAGTFTHEDGLGRHDSGLPPSSPRAAGRGGPGQSYGGSGGRASGSQAYGYERKDSNEAQDRRPPQRTAPPAEWERREQETQRPAPPHMRNQAWRPNATAPEAQGGRPGLERQDDTQFDADYRQWRDEQMRLLDRDYAQWRQERYRKFAEEFSQWRSQRLQARPPAATARAEHPGEPGASLGDASALGPVAGDDALSVSERGREREDRERGSGGGLLSSLLGGHGERHKP